MDRYTLFCSEEEIEGRYISKAKEVMTETWIDSTYKALIERSMHKELEVVLGRAHPFIANWVDIKMALRKAELTNESQITYNVGMFNIVDLGRKLYELEGCYDLDLMRNRLQQADLYEDACWELETAMALRCSGFTVTLLNPAGVSSYDIKASFGSNTLAVECKNKHVADPRYGKNRSFSAALAKRLFDDLPSTVTPLDLRVIVSNLGAIEDVKAIILATRNMLSRGDRQVEIDSRYRVELADEYHGVETSEIMRGDTEESCYVARQVASLRQAYSSSSGTGNRVFFRFPVQDLVLRNILGLVSKANKQVHGLQSCLFMRVPRRHFRLAVESVEHAMTSHFSGVSAAKVAWLEQGYIEGLGVREGSQEHLIINEKAETPLSQDLLSLLSKRLMSAKHSGSSSLRTMGM